MRRRVAMGFVAAIALTLFIGLSGWQGARRAEQDAYWVSHTHEVMETIQRTTRHVIAAETSAQAFALSGQQPLLVRYQTAKESIYQDENAFRRLTADNLSQQRRADVLVSQVRTGLAYADSIIAQRQQSQAYPGGSEALEIERQLDVVRATTKDMYDEEARLLIQRTERAGGGRRLTKIIAITGTFIGAGLWAMAGLVVLREIGLSSRARAQLSTLNAELEERVERRTAALQAEVAERKRAEEGRGWLAAIVESSDAAIMSKTLHGIITAWNRGAEKVFGYTAGEVIGKPMLILIPPDRANEEPEILARIARGESVEHFETIRMRKDGRMIDVSVTISPIRDGSGTIVGASKIARDITESKRATEALRVSERRYQRFVQRTAAGVLRNTLDDRVLECNDAMAQMLGYSSRAEFMADPSPAIRCFDASGRGLLVRQLRELGALSNYETSLRRRDGKPVWVVMSLVLVVGEDDSEEVIEATVIDITARKQAEEARRVSEQRYRRFVERTAAGVLRNTPEGRILESNDAMMRMLGYTSRTEFLNRPTPEIHYLNPGDRQELVRQLKEHKTLNNYEVCFKNKEDRPVWVVMSLVLVEGEDDAGEVMEATVIDITDRKQAEEQLAEQSRQLIKQAEELTRSQQALEVQRRLLQSVLDSMAEGLVAADATGKFLLWNPAAERIVGQGAADVPPTAWSQHYGVFMADTVTPFPDEKNPLALAIQGVASSAVMFVRNAGVVRGVWVEATANPLRDKNGVACGGVVAFRDITQRRLDEQKIRELNEELEERVVRRTEELEAANHELEAFTYSVSHDLRAPLRHIGGFSRILMEDFAAGMQPEARSHLQRIEDGTRRMGLLVDELLNLARVGRHALKLQVTEMNAVIEEVVALLQAEVEGRAVDWKIAELPTAMCDPILIKQVFQNLIANALKFSRTRKRAVIEISCPQGNGETVIAVRDNGVGFNMKYQDKLFGVFQRLHRAEDFEGTGVGLAVVQRIVNKHGGRVWAEAELDKGATFYFTLRPGKAAGVTPGQIVPSDAPSSGVENRTTGAGA